MKPNYKFARAFKNPLDFMLEKWGFVSNVKQKWTLALDLELKNLDWNSIYTIYLYVNLGWSHDIWVFWLLNGDNIVISTYFTNWSCRIWMWKFFASTKYPINVSYYYPHIYCCKVCIFFIPCICGMIVSYDISESKAA